MRTRFKNRIVGSGEEQLDQIMFNPRNWRIHPLGQQNALKGVLEEVGWVQQVIVNKQTGNLIDGHLRCQLAAREGEEKIPVLYVDVSEEEEAIILSTLDPIGAMAATDKSKLDDLLRSIRAEDEDVLNLLDELAEKAKTYEFDESDLVDAFSSEIKNMSEVSAVTLTMPNDDAEELREAIREHGIDTVNGWIMEAVRNAQLR